MIRFDHVSKRYPTGQAALRDVSFSIEKNEWVFITGHSGAGKSTLIKLIACIETASSGVVSLNGHGLDRLSRSQLARHRQNMGVIFQHPTLLHDQPVFDNVALPLRVAALSRREIERSVLTALDQVGLLDRRHALPAALSGGEQQRVGIARAMVAKPALILADEPTGNLDASLSKNMLELLFTLHRSGATVLLATHDLTLIEDLPYRRLHLAVGLLEERLVLKSEHGA